MDRLACAYAGRLLCSIAAGLLVGICAPAHAYQAKGPAVATPTHLRVVTDYNYPPFLFLDANGKPEGYEVDMWHLFEAHTGIKVDLVPMQWSKAQQELLSGRADVIDMIYRTPKREGLYDFSAPYAHHTVAIYVSRQIRGVHDVDSLRGFPVAVERGDACAEQLGSRGIDDLRTYPDYKALIQAAVSGSVRIFCMDTDPANYYLYRYSALDRFDQAFTLYTGQLRRAVRKGDAALLQVVEHGMTLVTPAERAALHKRWLEHPLFLSPYLHMARIAAAIAAALVLLMVLWVWVLRRSVARRTRELREEQAKLRALFDASPDGMWVKNADGVHVEGNGRVVGLLGVEREDMLGRTDVEIFGPERGAEVRALDEEVMRLGEHRTYIGSVPVPDGDDRQVEVIKVPLYAAPGTASGVLSVARDITERVRTEEHMRFWAHAFRHAAFGVAIFDARTTSIIAVNPVFASERGYTPGDLAGQSVDVLYPADLVAERRSARSEIDQRDHSLLETEQVARDGRRFPVLLDISVTHDEHGAPQYVIEYAQDISARQRAEAELRLAAVAFEMQAALMVTDGEGVIQRVNKAFTELTGYVSAEVLGKPASLLAATRADQESAAQLRAVARRDGYWQGERWIQASQGAPRLIRSSISIVRDDRGRISHFVNAMVDLTDEREAHASVDRMTFFDPLTNLPNRRFLHDRLQQWLDVGEPRAGALLVIDLDHFKRVNDLRGHVAGDRLLAMVARRLRKVTDAQCVLSRFSGGAFALLMPCDDTGVADHCALAPRCAERVKRALRQPFELGAGSPVTLTASIGWTAMDARHDAPDAVFKEAELAMYNAKMAGRDQVCRFEATMQEELSRHEALVEDLRTAIADDALRLNLQAQTDREGRVTSAEALLRWTRPCGEPVPADVFIPIAEQNGLILTMGAWVLQHACEQLAAWSTQPLTCDLGLAINVSARQFSQPDFVDQVRDAVATSGANPARLMLELTETAVMDDVSDAAAKLAQLRSLGICTSLDDFGTGYSSLAYLSQLPLDQLKIDRSFVARVPQHDNDAMVVQTVIGVGHGLGLEVIAEGVETLAQRQFLMAHHCDAFQGFLIARPMPVAEFEAMLENHAGVARLHRATSPRVRSAPSQTRNGARPPPSSR